ncbi:MAG: ribosomal RNA small subunit methyltransferase A [Calditrichaeota bacterium]|nr:ribosomal RNA small subunit methyltransferase A [Calditrichota bacterium]
MTDMNTFNRPLKRYSQNFLTNVHYQKKIVDALNIQPDDVVIEIGAGKGALTAHITDANPSRFIAVEIDERWVSELKEKFGSKVEILHQDILKLNFNQITTKEHSLKVIGNLPYHISSPILFRLIDSYPLIDRAVLMLQKEVARRICAQPNSKDYGILSVISQTYSKAEYLFEIKRGNFFPTPAVDSAVICLTFFRQINDFEDPVLYRKIVRTTFNFRRKKLKNSLSRIFDKVAVNLLDDSILTKRPEQLTVEEFKQLTNQISKVQAHDTSRC